MSDAAYNALSEADRVCCWRNFAQGGQELAKRSTHMNDEIRKEFEAGCQVPQRGRSRLSQGDGVILHQLPAMACRVCSIRFARPHPASRFGHLWHGAASSELAEAPRNPSNPEHGLAYCQFDRRVVGSVIPVILLALVIISVGADVVGRNVFSAPIFGASEVSVLAFVWLVWLGVIGAAKRDDLMGVRYFVDLLPPRGRHLVHATMNILVALIAAG